MLKISQLPGPRTEKGRRINFVSKNSTLYWSNSNKLIINSSKTSKLLSIRDLKISLIFPFLEKKLIIGDHSGNIYLFDIEKGIQIKIKVLNSEITSILQFDSFLVISGGDKKSQICILLLSEFLKNDIKFKKNLNNFEKKILCSENLENEKIAFGGEDKNLIIYNKNFDVIYKKRIGLSFLNCMIYNKKTQILIIGSFVGGLHFYDFSKNCVFLNCEKSCKSGIYGIKNYDDEKFITCSSDKILRIWNLDEISKFSKNEKISENPKISKIEPENEMDLNEFFSVKDRTLGLEISEKDKKIYFFSLNGNLLSLKKNLEFDFLKSFSQSYILDYHKYKENMFKIENHGKVIKEKNGKISEFFHFNKRISICKFFGDKLYALNYTNLFILNLENLEITKKNNFCSKALGFLFIENFFFLICEKNILKFDFFLKEKKNEKIENEISSFCFDINKNILIGTKNGNIIFLDQNLKKIKKIKISENFKIEKILQNEKKTIIGLSSGKIIIYENLENFKNSEKNLENFEKKKFDCHTSKIRDFLVKGDKLLSISFDNFIGVNNLVKFEKIKEIDVKKCYVNLFFEVGEKVFVGQDEGGLYELEGL